MSPTIIVFWPVHTRKERHLILVWGRKSGGVLRLCQWAGEHCSVTLQAHLGPQMMSFPIKIIILDRKQEGFDIFFIQKYESNYYLGSSIVAALWKLQNDIDFCGDKFPVIVHLSTQSVNQKWGFSQEGGIYQEIIELKEHRSLKTLDASAVFCLGSMPVCVN